MKLTKINYVSAVYFFALAFVLYLVSGIVQLIVEKMNPGTFSGFGLAAPTFSSSLLIAPIFGGLVMYLFALFAIFLYNLVAKRYPFSFNLAKK